MLTTNPMPMQPGRHYFPDGMSARQYYYPANRGLEIQIAEKLARLRALDKK